ncbi:hypothetical protein D9619_008579 [Psilocybe cf. subviscida]|uniref:DUF6534 domain-containing protein n=1 Tax=Psilocybe cf. subviscida TaxID=2480587 RepID=A0A8H5B9T7_9AGAR|nr:hypothetical protein D9619_008579 [Psilocybe cf. subviscida]
MSSPLDATYGIWLITLWIQTLLQGCGMLQVWLYFHWYKNDSWGIKAMVWTLLVIETFQSIVFFQVTYVYLIEGFGNRPGLGLIHWQDSVQLFAIHLLCKCTSHTAYTFVSALLLYLLRYQFSSRRTLVKIVDKKNKILPILITILALTQIGAGLAQTITTAQITKFAELGAAKPSRSLQSVAAFLCDVLITVSLVRTLGSHKGTVKSTNNMLDKLMVIAINRGSLTAICALLNLILFLAIPGTFWFFIGLTLSGKLYMNSALATLNSRQHITKSSRKNQGSNVPMSITAQSATDVESGRMHVVVTTKHTSDSDPDQYGFDQKSRTFIDGML